MSASDGRDRPDLTLLIQLFGREVLDRLESAGFGDESAIAAAGPDRLASASGVSLSLAQRIVAVVLEARRPPAGNRHEAKAEPSRTPREVRPRKAPSARAARKTPAPRVEVVPTKPAADEMDPFVDDVALVAWMGFSSKPSSGRLSFSVADRILDPVRPEAATTEEQPPSSATPAGDIRPVVPAKDPPSRRTLPGSFWSFGSPAGARGPRDEEASRPVETKDLPEGTTPRKPRDDH